MKTTKTAATEACKQLAGLIFDLGDDATVGAIIWKRADKIEKRWNIFGCTDACLETLKADRSEFLATESRKFDAAFPDRMSYLHR